MKNKALGALLALLFLLTPFTTTLSASNSMVMYSTFVQDSEATEEGDAATEADSTATDTTAATETPAPTPAEETEEVVEEEPTFHQILKTKFIEGGAGFMGIVLLALILGLALCIERIIYLFLADTNTGSFLVKVENALKEGGVDKAKELCRDTTGPVASIFFQGLDRTDEGLEVVEKAVVSYGGVQMGLLEKNISWISLFIALAPMLGFMGTVIGMISAFDSIEAAGDISPTLVAKGIKQALLTTVFGLIVAIILQIFYNFIVSKVDTIVNKMEDASIILIDLLIKYNK